MKKNVVAAVILGLFFGPCGLIYVSGGHFLLALVVGALLIWVSHWDALAPFWLGCSVWGGIAAAAKNASTAQPRSAPVASPVSVPAEPVAPAPRLRRPVFGETACISCGQPLPVNEVLCGHCGCRVEPAGSSNTGGASSKPVAGTGAELETVAEGLLITRVLPSSGAADAGLKAGDVILEVEGERVHTLGFQKALEAIRGPAGSCVVLAVKEARTDTTRTVSVMRRVMTASTGAR